MDSAKLQKLVDSCESLYQLGGLDAIECPIINHLNGEPEEELSDFALAKHVRGRGLVTLAMLRCAKTPGNASPPSSPLKPIKRRNRVEVSRGRRLLEKTIKRKIDNCWATFGREATHKVETDAVMAGDELRRIEWQNYLEGWADEERYVELRSHQTNMLSISRRLWERKYHIVLARAREEEKKKEHQQKLKGTLEKKAKEKAEEICSASPPALAVQGPLKRQSEESSTPPAKRRCVIPR